MLPIVGNDVPLELSIARLDDTNRNRIVRRVIPDERAVGVRAALPLDRAPAIPFSRAEGGIRDGLARRVNDPADQEPGWPQDKVHRRQVLHRGQLPPLGREPRGLDGQEEGLVQWPQVSELEMTRFVSRCPIAGEVVRARQQLRSSDGLAGQVHHATGHANTLRKHQYCPLGTQIVELQISRHFEPIVGELRMVDVEPQAIDLSRHPPSTPSPLDVCRQFDAYADAGQIELLLFADVRFDSGAFDGPAFLVVDNPSDDNPLLKRELDRLWESLPAQAAKGHALADVSPVSYTHLTLPTKRIV